MSTLRVNKIELNDTANAYIAIGNTYNVSIAVSGTDAIQLYSNGVVNIPSTSTLQAENLGGALAGAYNAANAAASAVFTLGTVNISVANITIANITSSLSVHGSASFANTNIASQTLSDGASITWDTSLGQIATITLGGARTLANATNLKVGTYILNVIQDGTGSRTLTWGRGYFFPGNIKPTLTTTAGARDIVTGVSDGTVLYCTYINNVSVS